MRAADGGGGGTVVVDIPGVFAASGKVGEAGQLFGMLARRIASHPMPDMPGGTAAIVEGALADAATMLAPLPEELIAVAQELRVRAFWAEIADQLLSGSGLSGTELKEFEAAYGSGLLTRYAEPWQKTLADAYAKKLYDDAHPGGILGVVNDVGNFFVGAFDAVKDTDLMIYHLSPYSPDPGKYWGELGQGVAHDITHPLDFGKQVIDLPALEQHGVSYWLGNMTPAVAAALLTGGAGAAARGAETFTLIDGSAASAATLERLAAASSGADRLDYARSLPQDLENFTNGQAVLHQGRLTQNLTVVQYYDADRATGTLKWWTTTDQANNLPTVSQLREHLALPPEWGDRNAVRVAVIPKGTKVDFLYGSAEEQTVGGVTYSGGGVQLRFRDFDPNWVKEDRRIP